MTSTIVSTPKLSEVARHLIIPEGIVTSVFPRVQRRMAEVGLGFDPWQQGFGTVALGCRADGKYAASVGGVVASIARQVGKTYTVGGIMIGLSLEFPGFQAAWTSHHNRTTTKTFKSMRGIVKRPQIYSLLDHSTRSDGIRASNGEQEIRFANESIIMFGAREQGFGRGLDELDAEVFDEAQILTLKALEDMVPATNQARNEHGGLLFFLGTPPRPTDPGEAFTTKRDQALSGRKKNIVYVEISADADADPDDREQWKKMNPSYPLRTPAEAIERMRENIPDVDSFKREAMGIWDELTVHRPTISVKRWSDMSAAGPADGTKPHGFGVDMSHARAISISACWTDGEAAHIEEVWAGDDPVKAVEWLVENAGRRTEVLIDSASPAASLAPELKTRHLNIHLTTAPEYAQACGLVENRANAEPWTLTHGGQDRLTAALSGAKKRAIRDAGGWGWDRRDATSQIHPIVSATLALSAATRRRRPSTRGATSAGGRTSSKGRVGVAL